MSEENDRVKIKFRKKEEEPKSEAIKEPDHEETAESPRSDLETSQIKGEGLADIARTERKTRAARAKKEIGPMEIKEAEGFRYLEAPARVTLPEGKTFYLRPFRVVLYPAL